ncbi:hypothetical protein [Oceanithermus sp.]
MVRKGRLLRVGALFGLLAFALAAAAGNMPTYPVKGQVVNELHLFDNPEAVIFSLDGRYLFVANTAVHGNASKPFGFTEGAGSISKLEVGPRGDARIVDLHFIDHLTSPLGMAVLPVNTRLFTRGTIFAPVGSAPLSDADGNPITDRKRLKTKIIAFNPDSGEIVGEINLSWGSFFARKTGAPVVLCNALAFDPEGNLYFTDTGFGADRFDPPIPYNGGTWKVPVSAIDDLASGRQPAEEPQLVPNPGWPDGVEVSPLTGRVWVNTVGGKGLDPANGGIWELSSADFAAGKEVPPVFRDLGQLDGLDFSASGIQFDTEIGVSPNFIIVIPPGGVPMRLALEPDVTLSGPADVAVRGLEDGSLLLAVPELTALDPTPWNDDLTIIHLPAGFEGATR